MKCPVCAKDVKPVFVESHRDPHSGIDFGIQSCPECGVVFSDPMKLPPGDWYSKALPFREADADISPKWWTNAFLRSNIKHGGKLLDIACGYGGFLLLAQKAGYAVSGIDFDPRVIETARSLGLKDVEVINFEDFYAKRKGEKFNVITLFGILEHIEKPDIFIEQVKELLSPGGYIAVVVPNDDRPLVLVREAHDYPPHHFTRWNSRSLKKFLEGRNFSVAGIIDNKLSLHCIKVNIYSLILKIISKLTSSHAQTASLAGGKLTGRSFRVIKGIYMFLVTPIAWLAWLCLKIRKPGSGSDIYLLAKLK